jgi:DNA replication and repair protein RecF
MKLAEGEISKESTGEYPVFLLDDVLSELDENRKRYILSNIEKRQVIITTCENTAFDGVENVNFIGIKDGKYYTEVVVIEEAEENATNETYEEE